MGGKGKDIDDTKDWPKANEVTLIQILVGKVREGKLQSSTFKKEVWAEINNEMHEAIGVDYGIDLLKGKRENEQELDDTEATSYGSNEEHVTFDISQTAEMAQVRDEIAISLWTSYRQN
ncbi:hypothetical protein V6N13_098622 [Hibiscus sabdariffa]